MNESMTAKGKKSGKDVWDVTGSWIINCPGIESEWDCKMDSLTLDIHLSKTDEGMQMWAEFDFNILEGVFRFIKPTQASRSKKSSLTKASLKRKRKDEDKDEEDENEDSDEGVGIYEEDSEDSSTPEEFILSTNDRPSPKCPKWDFRWRGEETGEGEIQLSSEESLCSITFHGTGGTKLTGIFKNDLSGDSKFTGLKIATADSLPDRSDPSHEWHSRSEKAYESARVNRWRWDMFGLGAWLGSLSNYLLRRSSLDLDRPVYEEIFPAALTNCV